MKKIISVLVIVMVFMLAGCEPGGFGDLPSLIHTTYDSDYINENYYTQEEVDEMIADLEDSFDAQAMNNLNERVMELESELRDFDRFEYEDLLEFEDYFHNEWLDILQTYLEENYQPLENCDSDCEIDKIDNQITITTIAQIDLVLYGLEHSQEPLTDEEQFIFDLYTQLREQLYLEIGGE